MNLRSATYVTAKEAANGALDDDEYGCEDENDVTTDTNHDSEPEFDSSDDDDFDPILGGDYIAADDFIDVEQAELGGKLSLQALIVQRE